MSEIIQTGKTASVKTVVTENNTAKAVGSGILDVFATPMMIALMEKAACACLSDALADGQTSVGTQINTAHTAASPIGAEITATAVIVSVDGRKVDFESAIKKFGKENGSKKLLPLPFIFFNEYVSNHFYGNKSAIGWCNIIKDK